MYAYCNNNPVMYVDLTGEASWIAVIVMFIFVVCLLSSSDNQTEILKYEAKQKYNGDAIRRIKLC